MSQPNLRPRDYSPASIEQIAELLEVFADSAQKTCGFSSYQTSLFFAGGERLRARFIPSRIYYAPDDHAYIMLQFKQDHEEENSTDLHNHLLKLQGQGLQQLNYHRCKNDRSEGVAIDVTPIILNPKPLQTIVEPERANMEDMLDRRNFTTQLLKVVGLGVAYDGLDRATRRLTNISRDDKERQRKRHELKIDLIKIGSGTGLTISADQVEKIIAKYPEPSLVTDPHHKLRERACTQLCAHYKDMVTDHVRGSSRG